MSNRTYVPIGRSALDPPISYYEKLNYDRIIQQLNSQNQYLTKNMKGLIIENMQLKNKLYSQKVFAHRPLAQEVEGPREERNGWKGGPRMYQRKGLKSNKVEEEKEVKESKESEFKRNDSPGESEWKKPTIIEELSDSHFEPIQDNIRNTEGKKGITLTPKKVDKMSKSQHIGKRGDPDEKSKTEHDEYSKKESKMEHVNESKGPLLPQTPVSKANPENESSQKAAKSKKNNSPYLLMFDSHNKAVESSRYTQINELQSSKKYNNQVYLARK